jgi:hypothetical protein
MGSLTHPLASRHLRQLIGIFGGAKVLESQHLGAIKCVL